MEYKKEHIRLLLFEEDSSFKDFLSSLLKELGYQHIKTFDGFDAAAHILQTESTSLCLIALNRADSNQAGLKLAEIIRDLPVFMPIIFLARFYNEDMYVLCRHLQPSAFLNKELSPLKLQLAIEQAFMHYSSGEKVIEAKNSAAQVFNQRLFFKTNNGFIAIPEQEILYFFSNQKTTHAKTSVHTYETQVQMQTLENALQERFIRIHKSYLINIKCIEAIQPNESSVVIAGESLPIGYAYRKSFFNRIKLLR